MGRSIPDADVELATLLGSVARRVRLRANRELEPLGVTTSQVRALAVLGRAEGPMRMRDLADRLRIARRTATGIVDELEGRGLAVRRPDPTDGRGVEVAVTDAGRALLRDVAGRRGAAMAELTAGLSADEVATLRDLLARLDAAP